MNKNSHWIVVGAVLACASWHSAVALGQSLATDEHAGHNHADGRDHSHGSKGHLTEKDIKLPRDFASAVARIKTCRDLIRTECEAKHFEEAHGPLDEASLILGKLMILARDSGVPKGRWQEVNLAGKELKKRLAEMDTALHRTGRIDFKAVATPIEESLKRLEVVAYSLARQTK